MYLQKILQPKRGFAQEKLALEACFGLSSSQNNAFYFGDLTQLPVGEILYILDALIILYV